MGALPPWNPGGRFNQARCRGRSYPSASPLIHSHPLDYTALGKRISTFRNASGLTQEQFCEKLNVSRKHISQIEAAISRPSLETLVDIANILNISADDLLVDSLAHSASTADSEIHRLLLDCNAIEQEILTRMVKEMKAILYGLGV